MAEKEILTPDSPRWLDFITRLDGAEGCNFRYKPGNGRTAEHALWDCAGDFALARKILKKMGGVEVEATLRYYREHGAKCDCEITFNF